MISFATTLLLQAQPALGGLDALYDLLQRAIHIEVNPQIQVLLPGLGTELLGDTRGCSESKTWTQQTALENCPPSSWGRIDVPKDFETACCNCTAVSNFTDALANKMYNSCSDTCMYNRHDQGQTAYEWNPAQHCYNEMKGGNCFVNHADWREAAVNHGKTICDNQGSTPSLTPSLTPAPAQRPAVCQEINEESKKTCPSSCCIDMDCSPECGKFAICCPAESPARKAAEAQAGSGAKAVTLAPTAAITPAPTAAVPEICKKNDAEWAEVHKTCPSSCCISMDCSPECAKFAQCCSAESPAFKALKANAAAPTPAPGPALAHTFTNVGKGKCQTASGELPGPQLLPGMTAAACQLKCDKENNCAGFSHSRFEICIIWTEPTMTAGDNNEHWESCMKKEVTEEQRKARWNMCTCSQPNNEANNKYTCWQDAANAAAKTCAEKELCFSSAPAIAGDTGRLCKAQDKKFCTELNGIQAAICQATKFEDEGVASPEDCAKKCLAEEKCNGYLVEKESDSKYKCHVLNQENCGSSQMKARSGQGSWNFKSRACFSS